MTTIAICADTVYALDQWLHDNYRGLYLLDEWVERADNALAALPENVSHAILVLPAKDTFIGQELTFSFCQ
jgi:hypothetical protein